MSPRQATMFVVVLTVCALVSVVEPRAVTISGGKCATSCTPNGKSPFGYSPGNSYEYDLEGSTALSVPVNGEEQTMKLRGRVKLVVLGDCEAALVLEQFEPIDADGEKYPLADLETHPLRFSWNGKVEHICPDAQDPQWSVNIKRAALSALQNSLDSFDMGSTTVTEVDISGECETEYDVSFAWTGRKKITKTKDLLKCKDRNGYRSRTQADSAAHGLSDINNLPLIRSEHRCEHELSDDKLISKATCTETHAYKPYLNHGQGAEVKVQLSLTLSRTTASTSVPAGSGTMEKSCLRFKHDQGLYKMSDAAQKAEQLLKDICKETDTGVDVEVPDLSYALIGAIRRLSKDQVVTLRNQIKSGGICAAVKRMENFFLELLPQAGGPGAIGVMAQIIKEENPNALMARAWVQSLAFDLHPSSESVEAALPLLDGKPTHGALLGISALGHAVCRQNENCQTEAGISALIAKLGALIPTNCQAASEEQKDTMIAALKSFGNLGRADQATESKIAACARNKKLDPNVRFAAIDGFRRMSCGHSVKDELLAIFVDSVDDSDVRIKAYQSLMTCACSGVIAKVEEVLKKKEESKQVRSYLETHIRNLQRTTTPSKHALKEMVAGVKVKSRSQLPNLLKESRNDETSFYSKGLGIGFSGETNVIYSQRSYVPRAADLNITLDLFGNTINVIEIGGRVENMEKTLEGIFGPGGTLRESVEDLKDTLTKKFEDLRDKADDVISRKKRSLPSDHALITNQIDSGYGPKQIYKEDPTGELYVRIFGNELIWAPLSEKKIEDTIKRYEDAAENKFENVDALSSINFLYGSMYVPTVLGFSIKLHLNATASAGFKYEESSAKFDFPDVNLRLKVTPNAVISFAGTMVVNAHAVKRGVRVTGSLKTTSSLDVSFQSSKSGVTAKMNLPEKNIDFFKLNSQSYFLTYAKGAPHKLVPITVDKKIQPRTHKACIPGMGKIFGVKLCYTGTYSGPRGAPSLFDLPSRALYPVEVGVTVEREDAGLKGYELVGKWKLEGKEPELSLYIDAPGSKEDRKLGFSAAMKSGPERKYEIFFKSPLKKLSASVEYTEDPNLRRFGAKFQYEKDVYAFNVQSVILKTGDRNKYSIETEYTTPSGTTKVLEGLVEYVKDKELEFKFKPLGVTLLEDVLVHGSFVNEGTGNNRNLEIKALAVEFSDLKLSTSGSLKLAKPNYSFNLATEFGSKSDAETLKLTGELVDNSKGDYSHGKGKITAETSLIPDLGLVSAEYEVKKEPGHIFATLEVIRGKDRDVFRFEDDVKYSGLASLSSLSIDGTIKISDKPTTDNGFNLLHVLKLDHSHLKHVWNLDYTLEGEKKQILSSVDVADRGTNDKADLELTASVEYPGKKIEYHDKFTETEKGVYNGASELKFTPGETYTLTTKIVDQQKDGEEKDTKTVTQQIAFVATSTGWQYPIEASIGRTVLPAVWSTNAALSKDNESKLKIDFDWTLRDGKGTAALANFDVDLKVFLKTVLEAKLHAKNEKSQTSFTGSVLLPRLKDRLIEGSATVTEDSATLTSVNAELAWDAKKDPSKKIVIDSDISFNKGRRELETKTRITHVGDRYNVDVKGSLAKKIDNGDTSFEIEVTFPSRKSALLSSSISIETTPKTYRETLMFTAKTLENTYYKTVVKTDVKQKNYSDLTGILRMEISLDTPKLAGNSEIEIDSKKEGDGRRVATKVKVNEANKANGYEVEATLGFVPESSAEAAVRIAHGTAIYIDADSKLLLNLETSQKETQLVVNLKSPEFDINPISVNSKLSSRLESWNDAKVTQSLSVTFGTNKYDVASDLSADRKSVTAKLNANHGKSKLASLDVSIDKQTPGVHLGKFDADVFSNKVSGDFEYRDTESWKKLSYGARVDLEMLGFDETNHNLLVEKRGDIVRVEIDAMFDGESLIDWDSEVMVGKKEPYLKSTIRISGEPASSVELSLKEKGASSYGIEGKLRWDEPQKYANFIGEVSYVVVPLSFDVKAEVDSPAFKIDKWRIVGKSNLSEGNKRQIRFKAETKKERDAYGFRLVYTKGDKTIDGTGLIKILSHNSTLDFSVPKDWVKQDVPAVLTVKSHSDNAYVPKELEFRRSKSDNMKEVKYALKATTKKQVYSLILGILNNEPEEGIDTKVTLSFEGKTKRRTTSYETVAALSNQNDAILAQFVSIQTDGGDPKKIGFDFELHEGKLVADLFLLERVVRVEDDWEKTEVDGRCVMTFVDKLWVDYSREPDQVIVSTYVLKEDEVPKGRQYSGSITLTHPVLPKELKVSSLLIIRGEKTPFQLKLDFDVYGDASPLLIDLHKTKQESGDDWETNINLLVSRKSDIDFRVEHQCSRKGDLYSTGLKVAGAKTAKLGKPMEIRLDVESSKALLVLSAPGHSIELEGIKESSRRRREAEKPDEAKWVWTLKQTGAVPVVAEVIHSTDISMPALSVQVYDSSAPTNRLRWRAGYVDTKTLNARLDSISNGVETLYASRTIALRPDGILSHKLQWRKENFRSLWEGAKQRAKMAGENLLDGVQALHDVVSDWRLTYEAAGRLEPAVDPLVERFDAELQEFIEELELDPTVMLAQTFVGIDDIRAFIETASDEYKKDVNTLKDMLGHFLSELEKHLGPELGISVADINNWVDRTGDKLEKAYNGIVDAINDLMEEIKNGKDNLNIEVITDFLDKVLDKVKGLFDFARDIIKEITEEYKIDEIIDGFEDLQDSIEKVLDYFFKCRYFKPLKDAYDDAKKWFRDEFKVNRVKLNEVWSDMKEMTNTALEDSGTKFVVWNPDQGEIEVDIPVPPAITTLQLPLSPFQKLVEGAFDTESVELVTSTIDKLAREILKELENMVLPGTPDFLDASFNVAEDIAELLSPESIAELFGPVGLSGPLGSLISSGRPKFESYSSTSPQGTKQSFRDSAKEFFKALADIFKYVDRATSTAGYASVAQSSWVSEVLGGSGLLSPLNALPPYKTSAYIIGSGQLVSFDRKVHNFVGKCKYILAREHVDGKYSLEAEYAGSSKPTLIFNALDEAGNYDSIAIAPDFSIKLNGQLANAPFRAGNVWVTKETPVTLQLNWDKEGVALLCDTKADFCRFRVTGWHHGRVSGLLGSNDRESVTDMLSPSGEAVLTVAELAAKWKVGGDCQDSPAVFSGPGLPACGKTFRDSFSPYGDCFKRVDPEPFRQACMELSASDDEKFCDLANAYRMACFEKAKILPVLEECKKCDYDGRRINAGIETEVKTSATAADVVLVVNQAECLQNVLELDAFVKELRAQAKDVGVTDLRLGVVGYGHKDIDHGHPTVLTSEGKVWFEGDAPGVDFKGNSNRGTMAALLMAAAFEFRPAATKSIVLFTCKPCQRNLEDVLLGRYYQVEKELLLRGITLHTLSSQEITVKTGKKKIQKQVIGADSNAAFKVNSLKGGDFQPDVELRAEIAVEPDYCTQLAQSSYGSVFSLARLLEVEDKAKQFRQVFARRVVASLTGPENAGVCQKCSCVLGPWGQPTVKCELCDPKAGNLTYRTKDQA